jgi:hypothetical protein
MTARYGSVLPIRVKLALGHPNEPRAELEPASKSLENDLFRLRRLELGAREACTGARPSRNNSMLPVPEADAQAQSVLSFAQKIMPCSVAAIHDRITVPAH